LVLKLERENNLPYWIRVEQEFLEQAINAYKLDMQLRINLKQEQVGEIKKTIIKKFNFSLTEKHQA